MTDWFKALRDAQVDRNVIETNKLLIRMSKLTSDDTPEDGPKRRGKEEIQNICQALSSWWGAKMQLFDGIIADNGCIIVRQCV